MVKIKMPKGYILRFLTFCLLYLLYILVGEIWFTTLYAHDNWINLSGIIIIAILLVPLYTFINTRLSLGGLIYIFYIPSLYTRRLRCWNSYVYDCFSPLGCYDNILFVGGYIKNATIRRVNILCKTVCKSKQKGIATAVPFCLLS